MFAITTIPSSSSQNSFQFGEHRYITHITMSQKQSDLRISNALKFRSLYFWISYFANLFEYLYTPKHEQARRKRITHIVDSACAHLQHSPAARGHIAASSTYIYTIHFASPQRLPTHSAVDRGWSPYHRLARKSFHSSSRHDDDDSPLSRKEQCSARARAHMRFRQHAMYIASRTSCCCYRWGGDSCRCSVHFRVRVRGSSHADARNLERQREVVSKERRERERLSRAASVEVERFAVWGGGFCAQV